MQAVGVAACAHIVDQLIERVVLAVVGADDADLPAPHGHGHGGLEQLFDVVHKGGFVNHQPFTGAPLGAQVAWVAGEGLNLVAAVEVDAVAEDLLVFLFQHRLLNLAGGRIEGLGPVGTVLDEALGHLLVVGDVVDVGPLGAGGIQHVVGRLGIA